MFILVKKFKWAYEGSFKRSWNICIMKKHIWISKNFYSKIDLFCNLASKFLKYPLINYKISKIFDFLTQCLFLSGLNYWHSLSRYQSVCVNMWVSCHKCFRSILGNQQSLARKSKLCLKMYLRGRIVEMGEREEGRERREEIRVRRERERSSVCSFIPPMAKMSELGQAEAKDLDFH